MMKNSKRDLLLYCKNIRFGAITLTQDEESIYQRLNQQMIHLCRSMPESVQTSVMLFMMRYAGIAPGESMAFFRNYPAPVWSIIHHLSKKGKASSDLSPDEYEHAVRAHSMAMYLHSLDDHLNDGDIPTSNLMLLMRSQAWMIMNASISRFAAGIKGGTMIAKDLINEYYSSICSCHEPESLDDYCTIFREQITTGLIIPMLLSIRLSGSLSSVENIRKSQEAFGIAWRLLDDLNDTGDDARQGIHSSVYFVLPEEGRAIWDEMGRKTSEREKYSAMNRIRKIIETNRVVDYIIDMICNELERAEGYAEKDGLRGLAVQYRELMKPLQSGQDDI
jgi:hypothetical protein